MKYLIFQKQSFGKKVELLATSEIDGYIVTLSHAEEGSEYVDSADELSQKEPQVEEREGEGLAIYDTPEDVEEAINKTKAIYKEKWPYREEPQFVVTPIP